MSYAATRHRDGATWVCLVVATLVPSRSMPLTAQVPVGMTLRPWHAAWHAERAWPLTRVANHDVRCKLRPAGRTMTRMVWPGPTRPYLGLVPGTGSASVHTTASD